MYVCNQRTKIIHTSKCGFGKRLTGKKRRKYKCIEEAIDNGYRFCERCSAVGKALRKEQAAIDKYCKNKKITYVYDRGMVDVITPYGRWRIIHTSNNGCLMLYHHNHKQPNNFMNYHNQEVYKYNLLAMFKYIYKHDLYREQNPIGLKAPQVNENLRKGSKKYKKQQKHINKFEKRRTRINNVKNVLFLLDQLESRKSV